MTSVTLSKQKIEGVRVGDADLTGNTDFERGAD